MAELLRPPGEAERANDCPRNFYKEYLARNSSRLAHRELRPGLRRSVRRSGNHLSSSVVGSTKSPSRSDGLRPLHEATRSPPRTKTTRSGPKLEEPQAPGQSGEVLLYKIF